MKKHIFFIIVLVSISALFGCVQNVPELTDNTSEILYRDGLNYFNQGFKSFINWKVRDDGGNFNKSKEILLSIPETKGIYDEKAKVVVSAIYTFEDMYNRCGGVDKAIQTLKTLQASENDIVVSWANDMIVKVKNVQVGYMKNILALDAACLSVKELVDNLD